MSIDKMFASLKDLNDWKNFAESQQKVITDLSKKNTQLKEEIEHLKGLVGSAVPLISKEGSSLLTLGDDEETICRAEIAKLRSYSAMRELTYEETKKLEIYTKISLQLRNQPKTLVSKTKDLSNENLIALLETKDE